MKKDCQCSKNIKRPETHQPPNDGCECGGRVTLEKVCEHCGIFYHPMGESKLKLQRLLEWIKKEGKWRLDHDDVVTVHKLTAKIKELMDEE
jgi:hypothetical protein